MTEVVKGWQCIGCGKIDAPQPCIGVCQDRKVELVYAADHLAAMAAADKRIELLEAMVREMAVITPRKGEWESSYRALQVRARRTLAMKQNVA